MIFYKIAHFQKWWNPILDEDVLENWPHNIKFKRNENPTFYNEDFEKIFQNLKLPTGYVWILNNKSIL